MPPSLAAEATWVKITPATQSALESWWRLRLFIAQTIHSQGVRRGRAEGAPVAPPDSNGLAVTELPQYARERVSYRPWLNGLCGHASVPFSRVASRWPFRVRF